MIIYETEALHIAIFHSLISRSILVYTPEHPDLKGLHQMLSSPVDFFCDLKSHFSPCL